ncbi:MAG: pilus assembly protein PilP [Nitrosomonas sp.]|nr:pilus assembly protein PilP [Nitrosomonas sp.]MBK7364389.1 pilus assembly protein PilP [Nitrosomonas sp.]
MIDRTRLLSIGFVIALVGCEANTYSDLEEFVNNSGEGLYGTVEPLPEIKTIAYFTYAAFELPSPFSPRKNNQVKENQGSIQPDFKRRKEVLESFPLENLAMVGTLQRGRQIYALIKAPDSSLHRVKIGNYLGQNFGLITGISEAEIKLREIIQDSASDWTEHPSTLMLQAQEQR